VVVAWAGGSPTDAVRRIGVFDEPVELGGDIGFR
jgi:hypothetical protein